MYILNNDNAPSVRLRYIKRVDNVSLFDSGFVKLFSLYLALDMAYKKTGKQTVIERLLKQIELAEAKVVSIDGQEKPPTRIQRSRYRRERNRVGSSSAPKYFRFRD